MSTPVRILAVAGSLRADSDNKKLLSLGVAALRELGAEVDVVDLKALSMPVYDEDLEEAEGMPANAAEFKRRLGEAQGFLFAVPEYNSSLPGGFKNALDWASRQAPNVYAGKHVALMSAAAGGFGGIRMMPHLRQVLQALGAHALPGQVTVSKSYEAFAEDGSLKEAMFAQQVKDLAKALVTEVRRRAEAEEKEKAHAHAAQK